MRKTLLVAASLAAFAMGGTASYAAPSDMFGSSAVKPMTAKETKSVVGKGTYADLYGYYGNLYNNIAGYYGLLGAYYKSSSYYYNAYYYSYYATQYYYSAYYYQYYGY